MTQEKTLAEMERDLRESAGVYDTKSYHHKKVDDSSRITRIPYLLWHLGFWAISTVLVILGRTAPLDSGFWNTAALLQIFMLVAQLILGSMRIRDAGRRQWWILTIFLPLAWVVWSCIPSRRRYEKCQVK